MNEFLNSKKLSDIFSKMDEKIFKSKMNAALDMLAKGNTEDLIKKFNKADKTELADKITEFDISKLENLNIDKDEIKKNITDRDLDKFGEIFGDKGNEVIEKIKTFLNQK